MIDRIPPHNIEAEMALLGAVCVDRTVMDEVRDMVAPDDFYAHVHETIFDALVRLYDRHEPLDKITLSETLRNRDVLEKVGGISYISSLMDTVQTAASARYYATIIKQKSQLRKLIAASQVVSAAGYEGEEDVEAAINAAEKAVYDVGAQAFATTTPIGTLAADAWRDLERRVATPEHNGLRLGFKAIDSIIAGLEDGNFMLVAARPSMGKTAWALNALTNIARALGVRNHDPATLGRFADPKRAHQNRNRARQRLGPPRRLALKRLELAHRDRR